MPASFPRCILFHSVVHCERCFVGPGWVTIDSSGMVGCLLRMWSAKIRPRRMYTMRLCVSRMSHVACVMSMGSRSQALSSSRKALDLGCDEQRRFPAGTATTSNKSLLRLPPHTTWVHALYLGF